MRKILFVCNTYYQLITAIQCRNTIFNNECVDVILSDHSKNAETIVWNLNKAGIFHTAYFLNSKVIDQGRHNISQVTREILTTVFGKAGDLKEILENAVYDEIIYYNLNSSIMGIYSVIEKKNKKVKCSRFEEGIVSYNNKFNEAGNRHYTKRIDLTLKMRIWLHKQNLIDNHYRFYCFFPQYYKGVYQTVHIPSIKDDDIIRTQLEQIFEVSKEDYISEKYIFFTGAYDFEGGDAIGEFEVVKKVADLVGNENLIVKTHPRDVRTIYQDNNIKVAKASSTPWEALQLCFDYQDKVLLTAMSGSLISTNLMIENPIKSFFLFNECELDGNPAAINAVNALKELMQDDGLSEKLKSIQIARNIEEIQCKR